MSKYYYRKIMILGIISILFFMSINTANSGFITSDNHKEMTSIITTNLASWTCMVYWVGDGKGDLPNGTFYFDKDMIKNINMMELSGSTSKINIIVQADDLEIWGGNKGNISGTRRYHIQYDDDMENLADYNLGENVWYIGEQNMGDPSTLKEFINWAVSSYPAEHYFLTLMGHGEGWTQFCQDYSSGGIKEPQISYFNPSTSMSIKPELNNVLSSSPHLDILFLFGCHMGQIEVFYQLKECADMILATENFGAGSLPMFEIPFKNLKANPQLTSVEIAQLFVDNYNPELEPEYDFYNNWSPLFGIQTKNIDDITQAISNLTEAIIKQYDSNPIKVNQVISNAFKQSVMETPVKNFYAPHAHELYKFAEKICDLTKNKMSKVYNAALELLSVIDNSSIIKHSKKPNEDYHGLAVFSPPRSLPNLKCYFTVNLWGLEILPRNRYKSLDFAEDTQWDKILDIMYPMRRMILKIFNID